MRTSYPYYLANEPVPANTDLAVTNKYTLEVATRVALADAGVRGHPFRQRRHDRTPLDAAQGRWQACGVDTRRRSVFRNHPGGNLVEFRMRRSAASLAANPHILHVRDHIPLGMGVARHSGAQPAPALRLCSYARRPPSNSSLIPDAYYCMRGPSGSMSVVLALFLGKESMW